METFLILPVLMSVFIALVAALFALRGWLRLRRTRAALRYQLLSEVARLALRTTEIEKNLAALDARAQVFPIQISELQQNLTTLRILTNVLATSLRQVQRILSSTGLKSSLARPLAEAYKTLGNRR